MQIRSRLLIAFVGVTILSLLIFGSVAVWMTVSVDRENKLAFLQQLAHDLGERIEASGNIEELTTDFRQAGDMLLPYVSHTLIQDTREQRTIAKLSSAHSMLNAQALEQLTGAITEMHRSSGWIGFAGQDYGWIIKQLPGKPYSLILIRRNTNSDGTPTSTLTSRLLVTSLLVIWVAVWVALILSSVIAQRLNKQKAILLHQALHDALTDLPNRNLLQDRLDQALHSAERKQVTVALFILDLDRFKEVNDTLGHHYGDELLQEVGRRVSGTLRESDTVARMGGDEFAVLLPETDYADAAHCAERIIATLDESISIYGMQLEARPSIGIAFYPEHGSDSDTLLQHADVAMYQAKRNRLGHCIYEQLKDPHSMRRLTMISELRAAIEAFDLVLHYQPKIDLRTRTTTGVEALVRWQHPTLGLLPPVEFIELAEQSGLITPLTHWVVNEALRQIRVWQQQGLDLSVAVNLSAHSLHDPRFVEQIAADLERSGVAGTRLEIELTETAMMTDMDRALEIFERFNALGVRLSIDDFGTGMSSLSYLKRLPAYMLKIDKSFVMDMVEDENNAVIVRSIIDLAHNIGRKVIAEGVQDRDALQVLQILGCDMAQGYFLSRPRSADDLVEWLMTGPWRVQPLRDRLTVIPG